MEKSDFKKLEMYHEKLEKMVKNQAVSHFDLEMKTEVVNILTKYGKMTGMCGRCNSHLLSIAAAAVRLYNENKSKKTKDNGVKRNKTGRQKAVQKDTDIHKES